MSVSYSFLASSLLFTLSPYFSLSLSSTIPLSFSLSLHIPLSLFFASLSFSLFVPATAPQSVSERVSASVQGPLQDGHRVPPGQNRNCTAGGSKVSHVP